jgi:hypothetical protein
MAARFSIAVNIREEIQARRGFKWIQDAWVCNGLIRRDVDAPASGRAANRRRYDGRRANFSYSTAVDVRVLKGNRPNQLCMGNRDVCVGEGNENFGYSGREDRGRSKDPKTQGNNHAYKQSHMYES